VRELSIEREKIQDRGLEGEKRRQSPPTQRSTKGPGGARPTRLGEELLNDVRKKGRVRFTPGWAAYTAKKGSGGVRALREEEYRGKVTRRGKKNRLHLPRAGKKPLTTMTATDTARPLTQKKKGSGVLSHGHGGKKEERRYPGAKKD